MAQKKKTGRELIKGLEFVVFDLETTGGNHKYDKIIEIGLVKIRNLKIVSQKSYLINPEIKIPDFIQKLTSIRQEDIQNAPIIEELIDELLDFMGESILVAHNTSFDVPFFNSVLKRLRKEELKNKSLCTNLMTKYLIPNLLNSNLNYMSKIFNIKHPKAHRALDDAMATAKLLLKYLHVFIAKDIQKINHLYYPRNRYELDSLHFRKEQFKTRDIERELSQLDTPSLVTLKGENGIILYSLPYTNRDEEREVIKEKLERTPWLTVSIKLFGPFIELLIHFNNLFSKIEDHSRKEIITLLRKIHLPQVNFPSFEQESLLKKNILPKDFGDFIIAHHLVPEQMIIFPLNSLHIKNQLIFRYPGHKKKMLQYMNSKSQRIKNGKLKGTYFHPLLKSFIQHYLNQEKERGGNLLILKKERLQTKSDGFFCELEKFSQGQEHPYNYPQKILAPKK